jgi:hypothetical protein
MKYLWIHVYISPYYTCKCSVLQRIRFIIKISESISTVGYKLKELFSDGMCGDCVEAQIYFIFEIVIQKAIISLPLLYLSVETKSRALRLSSVRHLRLSLNKTSLSLYLSRLSAIHLSAAYMTASFSPQNFPITPLYFSFSITLFLPNTLLPYQPINLLQHRFFFTLSDYTTRQRGAPTRKVG